MEDHGQKRAIHLPPEGSSLLANLMIKTITDEQIEEISEWMVDHGYLSYEEFVESIKKGEITPFW